MPGADDTETLATESYEAGRKREEEGEREEERGSPGPH